MNLKRFLLLGNIFLSGAIIWGGASIVITWASNRPTENPVLSVPLRMPIPKNLTSTNGKRLEDYALIASKDVFHTTKETANIAGKNQAEDINVTELRLELKGTVVGDGEDSYAFIIDKGTREERVYYVNDYVVGAQILRIMNDRVILNVNGRRENLLMVSLHKKATPAERQTTPPQGRIIPPRRGMGKTGGS